MDNSTSGTDSATLDPVGLWVEALRSGDFEQGQSYLHSINSEGEHRFCCLGVACELYQQHVGGLKVDEVSGENYHHVYYQEFNEHNACVSNTATYAPRAVMGWLGLQDSAGHFGDESLVRLNDIERADFARIAEIVESRPKGLFSEEVAA